MTEKIEDLIAEVLMENHQHSAQESFLIFLIMEPLVKQLRSQGISNLDILNLGKRIDENNNE